MRKRPWMLPAMLLVLVFAIGLILEAVKPLGSNAATVGAKWVDDPTDMKYEEALGSLESTRYSGRVWADKTVYQGDVDLGLKGEVNDTITLGDDDFLIGYSLLAATTVVSGQSVVPLDVVFVIDLSTSMVEQDKIGKTVVALNQAVKTLMNGHPDTRIAVVTYSTEASVLLPLDHYGKVDGQDYFSLTGEGEDQILWSHVVGSDGQTVETFAQMSGWTNIHMAMDTGMDLLLNAEITTDTGVARHPALMLMSDGAPTCAGSDDEPWWNPEEVGAEEDFGSDGTGTYTLRTIMNAAYQKQRVTEHYSSQGEDLEMQVYTVGVGVDELYDVDKALAKVTLDPANGLQSSDYYAQEVNSAWENYLNQGEPTLGGYTFTHPDNGDITSVNYNDGYFYAENAEGIAGAFEQVLNKIIVTGAVPTEVEGDPAHSGYITYTDPIGEYMEVKKVKALVWNNMIYNERYLTVSQDGNVTTYVFKGAMTSPVYGQNSLSEIIITVTTDPDTKDQTLKVEVPAALIPLRMNTVTLGDNGEVEKNEHYNDEPLRLFYTVGMRDDVLTDENKVDLTKVDSEYIAGHTTQCNKVIFYSNLYSKHVENQAGVEKTVGDATVTFVPADTNPFYFNQADRLLYANPECTEPATPGLSTVYVKVSYYDGTESTFAVVERSTSYNPEDIKVGEDGFLYLKAGSRCNLSDRIIDKGEGNVTKTAETYHYPIYSRDEQTGQITGIKLYLGNNGALIGNLATGELTISKTVTGNMGETDRGFVFDITLYHGTSQVGLDGTYVAVVTTQGEDAQPSAQPTPTPTPTSPDGECPEPSLNPGEEAIHFENGKAQVTLKDGQSITIQGLPAGYTYTVTEHNPDTEELDYTVTATQNGQAVTWKEGEALACAGTIVDKQTDQVAYTNKCYIPMVDFSFVKVDGSTFHSDRITEVTTLSGAQFILYQYQGTAWETDQTALLNPQEANANWGQVGSTVTSDEDGVVTFTDLREGNYRLIETVAPDGYQLPKGQWNLTVAITGEENNEIGTFTMEAIGDSTMDAPAMAQVDQVYYLMNYKPINPPITGGDGGETFRIGGGLLMFTGAALAIWQTWSSPRRRRKSF